MAYHTHALSTVAAATFVALAASASMAGAIQTQTVHIPAVIGAAYNDANRADSAAAVRRQGGFATAGTVRWLAATPDVEAQPIYVPSVIGAMHESRSLARSAGEVSRQGGFVTAGAVHWLTAAPVDQKVAAF